MTYQLIKSNLFLNPWWTYIAVLFTVMALNSVQIPYIFIMIIIVMAFIINQFYYDQKSSTNRFFISLPISKKSIVYSRYLSVFFIAFMYILFQWGLGYLQFEAHYVFSWKDFVALTSLIMMMMSIVIPLFYLIPSFIIAIGNIFLLMFMGILFFIDKLVSVLGMEDVIIFNDLDPGLVLLVEAYIPFQPYWILTIGSIALFYLSMKISEVIFSYRDY